MRNKKLLLVGLLSIFTLSVNAQVKDNSKDSIPPIQKQIDASNLKIKQLEKLKISGYFQAQTELGQIKATAKTGANSGQYSESIDGKDADYILRYGLRRGFLKFQYTDKLAKAVFQFNINDKGIALIDAYMQVYEPYLNMFSLQAGIFNRCFGDEITYPSSQRETPERSLVFLKLFPDERDLGGQLTIKAPQKTILDGLKLDAGLFSGNGIRVDDNSKLDFIGHLKYDKTYSNISFGLGTSMYLGTTNNADSNLYKVENGTWKKEKVDTNKTNLRKYFGFDGQVSIKTFMGITNIRAEYLFGEQPSVLNDFSSPKGNTYIISSPFSYIRNFTGGHIYLLQDIYKTPLTLVLKYAFLDPNTKLKGNQIKNKADLSITTFSFGGLWNINPSLRLMAFYDINSNEKAKEVSGYNEDVKDNLFTLRLQYKFKGLVVL